MVVVEVDLALDHAEPKFHEPASGARQSNLSRVILKDMPPKGTSSIDVSTRSLRQFKDQGIIR